MTEFSCPHCGGKLNLSPFNLTPTIPVSWCEVKVPDDKNIIYLCDGCKKEVKEGYIKYPDFAYAEYSVGQRIYSQPNSVFFCKCCARKNGVERQYLLERELVQW